MPKLPPAKFCGLVILCLSLYAGYVTVLSQRIFASSTSNFTQTINAGSLTIDIVNGSYVTVASPAVAMSSATFSFQCQSTSGTFGTASEQIYIKNPDAADGGWTGWLRC